MAETYKLQHTAEAIDRKLTLIAENKNLLPYPYEATLPAGLTNVGDGSILTSEKLGAYSDTSFLLNHCVLAPGKYTVSIDITTILEEPTIVSGFALKIEQEGKEPITVTDRYVLELSEETTATVSLVVPDDFETGLVIKPQIEEGEEKTAWVPNMDQIGAYVDRRFNGTNTKIKAIAAVLEKFAELSDEQLQKLISFVDVYVELDASPNVDDGN
jgi:hypothetical protein